MPRPVAGPSLACRPWPSRRERSSSCRRTTSARTSPTCCPRCATSCPTPTCWSSTTTAPTAPASSSRRRPPSWARSSSCAGPASRASAAPTARASRVALDEGYDVVVSMDVDFSHDPAVLPDLLTPHRRRRRRRDRVALRPRRAPPSTGRSTAACCRGGATGTRRSSSGCTCATARRASGPTGPSALRAIDPATTDAEGYAFLTELVRRLVAHRPPGDGDADRVHRPAGRAVEDVGPDRRRVDAAGHPLGRCATCVTGRTSRRERRLDAPRPSADQRSRSPIGGVAHDAHEGPHARRASRSSCPRRRSAGVGDPDLVDPPAARGPPWPSARARRRSGPPRSSICSSTSRRNAL